MQLQNCHAGGMTIFACHCGKANFAFYRQVASWRLTSRSHQHLDRRSGSRQPRWRPANRLRCGHPSITP